MKDSFIWVTVGWTNVLQGKRGVWNRCCCIECSTKVLVSCPLNLFQWNLGVMSDKVCPCNCGTSSIKWNWNQAATTKRWRVSFKELMDLCRMFLQEVKTLSLRITFHFLHEIDLPGFGSWVEIAIEWIRLTFNFWSNHSFCSSSCHIQMIWVIEMNWPNVWSIEIQSKLSWHATIRIDSIILLQQNQSNFTKVIKNGTDKLRESAETLRQLKRNNMPELSEA